MKRSFINLLREPDSVLFQYEDSDIRFEEADGKEEQNSKIEYKVTDGYASVVLYPYERPVKRIKLRFRGDMSDVILVMGDAYIGGIGEINWSGLTPERKMPWYFQAYDGEKLNCFGVKTQPNAFCYFECDPCGITLWIDVRNGGGGVRLKEPLECIKVVCREGSEAEAPFNSARAFCRQMCDNTVLPKEPVFGVNDWYWAYGKVTRDIVRQELRELMELSVDAKCKPYLMIDDGWQKYHYISKTHGGYNGGPWDTPTESFGSMAETANEIHEKGAKAGIWFRPLRTCVQVPSEFEVPYRRENAGIGLDPSHPGVLEMVAKDTAMIRGWGYDLIKYDFTTFDTLGIRVGDDWEGHFFDRSITNCQMLKKLYKTVQNSADGAVILGCGTVSHLAAGIHEVQRTGTDTSGRLFEITRKNGGEAMMRLPQNGTFYAVDPDCAAFTPRVDAKANLDFMEMCAITGCVTLASITPGILKAEEINRIRKIFKIASEGGKGAIPKDWIGHSTPSVFETTDGGKFIMDWYSIYDGVRDFYTWTD